MQAAIGEGGRCDVGEVGGGGVGCGAVGRGGAAGGIIRLEVVLEQVLGAVPLHPVGAVGGDVGIGG